MLLRQRWWKLLARSDRKQARQIERRVLAALPEPPSPPATPPEVAHDGPFPLGGGHLGSLCHGRRRSHVGELSEGDPPFHSYSISHQSAGEGKVGVAGRERFVSTRLACLPSDSVSRPGRVMPINALATQQVDNPTGNEADQSQPGAYQDGNQPDSREPSKKHWPGCG
jgi:hypothetical protein